LLSFRIVETTRSPGPIPALRRKRASSFDRIDMLKLTRRSAAYSEAKIQYAASSTSQPKVSL